MHQLQSKLYNYERSSSSKAANKLVTIVHYANAIFDQELRIKITVKNLVEICQVKAELKSNSTSMSLIFICNSSNLAFKAEMKEETKFLV